MKTLIKIIFNIITFCILWWIQYAIMLGISVGLGLWDPSGFIGALPGVVALVCLYTSYVILKEIHKTQLVKNFFN